MENGSRVLAFVVILALASGGPVCAGQPSAASAPTLLRYPRSGPINAAVYWPTHRRAMAASNPTLMRLVDPADWASAGVAYVLIRWPCPGSCVLKNGVVVEPTVPPDSVVVATPPYSPLGNAPAVPALTVTRARAPFDVPGIAAVTPVSVVARFPVAALRPNSVILASWTRRTEYGVNVLYSGGYVDTVSR